MGQVLQSGRPRQRAIGGFGEKGKYIQTAAFKVQSSSSETQYQIGLKKGQQHPEKRIEKWYDTATDDGIHSYCNQSLSSQKKKRGNFIYKLYIYKTCSY